MSPKKAHEVEHLSNLIDSTYETVSQNSTRLIVDVGAGQGYLSHKLAEHDGTRVLALDGDEGQTEGATLRSKGFSHAERQQARKQEGSSPRDSEHQPNHDEPPPVIHRTLFITSNSLLHAVDEWIAGLKLDRKHTPHPVLITGLHACGSLTPAVLRCFVDLHIRSNQETSDERGWAPSALVLVGCCYNLMRSSGNILPIPKGRNPVLIDKLEDFPLSRTTARVISDTQLKLTPNHLQLAAQCPAQWTRSPSEIQRASLARRKIVWRALLARLIHNISPEIQPVEGGEHPVRLGRLPDRAYSSWDVFLRTASSKMGLSQFALNLLLAKSRVINGQLELPSQTEGLAFQLEILHILRALIGPVVESLIVVDRVRYLAEEIASPDLKVRALNVFDQLSSGSARNIALIVEPEVKLVIDN